MTFKKNKKIKGGKKTHKNIKGGNPEEDYECYIKFGFKDIISNGKKLTDEQILGVEPIIFTNDDVKQNYKKLVLKYHPDKGVNKNTHCFDLINKAYKNLLRKRELFNEINIREEKNRKFGKVHKNFIKRNFQWFIDR